MKAKMEGDLLPEYSDAHIPISRLRLSITNGRDADPPEDKQKAYDEMGLAHPPVVWYDEDTSTFQVEEGWQRKKLIEQDYLHLPCKISDSHEEALKFTDCLETRKPQTDFTKVTRYANRVKVKMEKFDCTESKAIDMCESFDISKGQVREYIRVSELPRIVRELVKKGGKPNEDDAEPRREEYMGSLKNYTNRNPDLSQRRPEVGLNLSIGSHLRTYSRDNIDDEEKREQRVKEIAAEIATVTDTVNQRKIIQEACDDLGKDVGDIVEKVFADESSKGNLGFSSGVWFRELNDRHTELIWDWIDDERRDLKKFVLQAMEMKADRYEAMENDDKYALQGTISGKLLSDFEEYYSQKSLPAERVERELLRKGLEAVSEEEEEGESPPLQDFVPSHNDTIDDGTVAELAANENEDLVEDLDYEM